jgi:endonuclease V-like protein UPF0215 family
MRHFTHAIGFDDAPFARSHRGNVLVVGTVYAGSRLEGVLSGHVRRDGANATATLAAMLCSSRFRPHLQIVFLQGIAFAGFNVVDLPALHAATGLPVLVVVRKRPDLARIGRALREHVPGGARKWRLIARAGPIEQVGTVYVQRAGLTLAEAQRALALHCTIGNLPEPLRTAHLIAGGIVRGESRHRA